MTLQKTTDTETFAVRAELSENVQNVGGVLLVAFFRQITQIIVIQTVYDVLHVLDKNETNHTYCYFGLCCCIFKPGTNYTD